MSDKIGQGRLGTDTAHSSRVMPYIYICVGPRHTIVVGVPSCPFRVRCNNIIDTMFSPNPAPSTAGSGYTRVRTPQGGMTQTALSALFPTATTTEGLTATELASQTLHARPVDPCTWESAGRNGIHSKCAHSERDKDAGRTVVRRKVHVVKTPPKAKRVRPKEARGSQLRRTQRKRGDDRGGARRTPAS